MATKQGAGVGNLTGHFDATLAVLYLDASLVASWLPKGVSLGPRGPAPEGTHPVLAWVARGREVVWSLMPLWSAHAQVMAVMVSGVTVDSAPEAGAFSYVLRWWAGTGALQRFGARLMGMASAPEQPKIGPALAKWVAEVPGMVKLSVEENGRQPNWPRVRALCATIQLPLLAEQPDGRLAAAGLYWNLGEADMRSAVIDAELHAGLLGQPGSGAAVASARLDGTSQRQIGAALRLGSDWTLSRIRPVGSGWSTWRARPTMRLRSDLALIDVRSPKATSPEEEEEVDT